VTKAKNKRRNCLTPNAYRLDFLNSANSTIMLVDGLKIHELNEFRQEKKTNDSK